MYMEKCIEGAQLQLLLEGMSPWFETSHVLIHWPYSELVWLMCSLTGCYRRWFGPCKCIYQWRHFICWQEWRSSKLFHGKWKLSLWLTHTVLLVWIFWGMVGWLGSSRSHDKWQTDLKCTELALSLFFLQNLGVATWFSQERSFQWSSEGRGS